MRVHRLLLRLLPAEFRARHGSAMTDAFAAMHSAALRRGRGAVAGLWLHEGWDLLRTSIVLRISGRAARSPESDARSTAERAGLRAPLLVAWLNDAGLAVRTTRRRPGFLAFSACTLALGIGATTAMYSALKVVVLDPVAFPTAPRLVTMYRTFASGGSPVMLVMEPQHIEVLREQSDVFDAMEAYGVRGATLTGLGDPERVLTLKASPGLHSLMGVQPLLGRTFLPEEIAGDGQRVLLLSHGFWRARFGGRSDVLGRTIQLDGEPWTVIGVMPREAVMPNGDPQRLDFWLPLTENDAFRTWVARLAPGATLESAGARVDAVSRADEASSMPGIVRSVVQPGPLDDHLRLLMIAVSLLLLVACVNVSNLLVQRAAVRSRETAVRSALGASRARLIRQFMLESFAVALTGGVLGAGLAWLGLRAMLALRPEQLAILHNVRVDAGVLAFCLAVAVAAGLVLGVLPALHGSRASATAALGRASREGGVPTGRFGWSLVTVEVALSFALLVGATLVVSALREMSSRDPGFRVDGLVAVDVRLPSWRYRAPPERAAAFERLIEEVRRLPAVRRVSLADGVPPRVGGIRFGHVQVEGAARDEQPSIFQSVEGDADFLATLGQPLVAGRAFRPGDDGPDAPAVILTRSAAQRLFPGENAIGRRFRIEGPPDYTVVGMVEDVLATGYADQGRTPLAYWALRRPAARMTLVVRSERTDAASLLELRRLVREREPDAIVEVATVRELFGASLARERFTTSLLGTFAALALLLAAVGLYGVLSQVVVARTREIGVRMALGADRASISRLILGRGLAATSAGLVLGALLASGGLRVMRSEVFGLGEGQPVAWLAAGALLLGAAVLSMIVPARRAARLDPMRAIRVD